MTEILSWVLYFFIYAFVGYVVEVTVCSVSARKLVNRGFLFGPILPIYGWGAVVCLLLAEVEFLRATPALMFLAVTVACSAIEYLTSLLLEKQYGVRLWDYSKTDRFNLGGRICLRNALAFGFFGTLVIYKVQPDVANLVGGISPGWRIALAITLVAFYLLDSAMSSYAGARTKKMVRKGVVDFTKMAGDQTNEIKRIYREAIKQLFSRKESFEARVRRIYNERRERFISELEARRKNLEAGIRKITSDVSSVVSPKKSVKVEPPEKKEG